MSKHNELNRLRSAIDLLDDQILELVERRIALARQAAAAKPGQRLLKLCPEREAQIVARLQARNPSCGSAAVRHIWRELIGHSLQAQGRLELVMAGGDEELEAPARALFGSAPALVRVRSRAEALERARVDEAVAVLRWPVGPLPAGLRLFRTIRDEQGTPIAGAVGRVADERMPAVERPLDWSPASWRGRTASHMPIYADAEALAGAERELARAAPVVGIPQIAELKRALARAAAGRAFLVQAGDCAESFDAFGAEHVVGDHALMLRIGAMLPGEVVHVARAAGQFGKPRSAGTEVSKDGPIPTYRGDAVNGAAATRAARSPDPARLLRAQALSSATAGLLDSLAAAAVHARSGGGRVYASHEALLLHYEQALTRWDETTGRWWATSGHMVWIGHRTRGLDGAHVEYARGIANPIGLKCGPDLDADALLRLIDRLDPTNEPGRLTLIGRFGADAIGSALPALMRATRAAGRAVLWASDPMHGNGRVVDGWKTRRVEDVIAELRGFFQIAAAEGVHAGGVHLEATSRAVVECIGGADAEPLGARYESLCDPRLNAGQALAVAAAVAECLARREARAA